MPRARRLLLPLALALVVPPAAPAPARAGPHPNSISSSRVTVTGAAVHLELRCQAQSLLEVFGAEADRDGDGALDDAELEALHAPLEAYVNRNYVLRAGSGGDAARGTLLPGTLTGAHAAAPETDTAWPTQWVDLTFDHRAAEPLPDLLIDVTLFRETAPDHSDLCTLVWNGGEPVETQFWLGEFRRFHAPEAPPVTRPMTGWVRLGIGHILSGWDHIAFVLVLVLAAGSARELLGVVTAFTLAHSLTLALAALDVVHVSGRPVEVAIALSIAWVGAITLVAQAPRARWREAFVFGLVHGLGFAGFLGEALAGEPR
ncbi:MAG TPA: HupE/UreJ family protein, partial [Planctomycetota bacterium]|nr:HupE/UreJ family protein [Planctomycetota bacterium]